MISLTQEKFYLENKIEIYETSILPELTEIYKELEKEKNSLASGSYLEELEEINREQVEAQEEIRHAKERLAVVNATIAELKNGCINENTEDLLDELDDTEEIIRRLGREANYGK